MKLHHQIQQKSSTVHQGQCCAQRCTGPATRVFIGCIPGNSNADELTLLLGEYCEVQSVSLALDTNRSRENFCLGYGFAQCQTKADVETLVSLSNKIVYRGRNISLREYRVGSRLREDKNAFNKKRVYLGNLPEGTLAEDLRPFFEKFGTIENCYIVKKSTALGNKFGYLVYDEPESAQYLLQSNIWFELNGQKIRIEPFGGKANEQTAKPFGEKATMSPFESSKSKSYMGSQGTISHGLISSDGIHHVMDTRLAPHTDTYIPALEVEEGIEGSKNRIHTQSKAYSPFQYFSTETMHSEVRPSQMSHLGIKALSRQFQHQHEGQLGMVDKLDNLSSIIITKPMSISSNVKESYPRSSKFIASSILRDEAPSHDLQSFHKAEPLFLSRGYNLKPFINGRPILKAKLCHSPSNLRFVLATKRS